MWSRAMLIGGLLLALVITSSPLRAASTARSRVYPSKHSIVEIVGLLGAGLIDELARGELQSHLKKADLDKVRETLKPLNFSDEEIAEAIRGVQQRHGLSIGLIKIDQLVLLVDGNRFPNRFDAVMAALKKIVDWHRNTDRNGSVRLSYRLRFPSFTVFRETLVEDDHVRMTTHVVGNLGQLTAATFISDAVQSRVAVGVDPDDATTTITNTLWACAPYGRCPRGPVTRIVKRVMNDRIDIALCRIEREAVALVARGESIFLSLSDAFLREIQDGLQ